MGIASYIREIGRGKESARSLSQAQSGDLMGQLLDGRLSDLEIGAFALAMRIKGETVAELAGFLGAVESRCLVIQSDRPTVVLPSYNGARKLPNLTPLLALLLAQEGVQVLVHGPRSDPARVTSADIFHDLGLSSANDASDIEQAWSRREPVFVRTEALCPPLARLLDVRRIVGLRNSGHVVAKLLDPVRGGVSLRVVNYTHPEYLQLLGQFMQHTGADAMLMRGTEGEPVADPRRNPRLDVYLAGQARSDLSRPAQVGALTDLPLLPQQIDAATTASYIQAVVSGEKPTPVPIARQVDALLRTLVARTTPG